MSDGELDWLDNEQVNEHKREQRNKAIEFAREHYHIFTTPAGQKLLGMWDEAYLRKVTPTESSIQVYAADNAVREFINGIKKQIALMEEEILDQ